MRTIAILSLFAGIVAGPASAQITAQFLPFGVGCSFQGQALAIGNQGLPQLGQTLRVLYTGPNFTFSSGQQIAHPCLVLGLGTALFPIPTTILPQQPPGCTGLITPDVTIVTQPDINGRPQYDNFVDLAVPNAANLIGFVFNAQWLTIVQQCGFAGCNLSALATSDAALVQVGT